MSTSSKLLILYHARCLDGFGAAWAVATALGPKNVSAEPFDRERLPKLGKGDRVLMVDCAHERPVLERWIAAGADVRVIDHHASNQTKVGDLPGVEIDTNHSAAVLAWNAFHPGEPVPQILVHVEDQDLHRYALSETRAMCAALREYPMTFNWWTSASEADTWELTRDGRTLIRHVERIARASASQARLDVVLGYVIPVVNATEYVGDVAQILLDEYPESPFAGVYHDLADGTRKWSFRSRSGEFDVQALLSQYGGGGHPGAGALRVRGGAIDPRGAIPPELVGPASDAEDE